MGRLHDTLAMPLPPAPTTAPVRLPVLVAQVATVNLLIASLIAMISGSHFGPTLVYSECIGMSIFGIVESGRRALKPGPSGWPAG